MKIIIICLVTLTLIGCSNGGSSNTPPEENIIVYISKGSTQCFEGGVSPNESAQVLIDSGIDVIDTFCGSLTGVLFPAVCGGATGEILAHEIREVNLSSANELGYETIEGLVDNESGTGYEIAECQDT